LSEAIHHSAFIIRSAFAIRHSTFMNIDSHMHFWRYIRQEYEWIDDSMASLQHDLLPAAAAAVMREAGMDACVAVQARQTLDETRFLLGLAEQHQFIAGVVGWVDLRARNLDDQLAELSCHRKLVGLRHIVQAEADDFLLREDFRRGVAKLERYGFAYDILIYARQLPAAIDFAAALPAQRLVLDHLGKPDIRGGGFDPWRRDLDRLAKLPHVRAKLSGLVTEAGLKAGTTGDEKLEAGLKAGTTGDEKLAAGLKAGATAQIHRYINAALDSFGAERLMIGSDWPVCTVAARYSHVIDLVRSAIAERTASERAAIMGGTARTFWNLSLVPFVERSV
jgi:L-fuconolactonase